MFHFKVDVFEVKRPETNEAIVRTSDTERLIDTEAVQRYPRTLTSTTNSQLFKTMPTKPVTSLSEILTLSEQCLFHSAKKHAS